GFGDSGKPDIAYSFFNQATYLEGLIRELRLENVTLLVQDWGSALGFDYAMRHEDNVRGIAFFEAILKPYESWDVFPKSDPQDPSGDLFRRFRRGGVGGEGWKLIVEDNYFIETLLPQLVEPYKLTREEWEAYRKPFKKPGDRKPIWRFPQEIPIE